MQLLPGLGRIKVRRIKDAFEKPFYPHPVAMDKRIPNLEVQSLNKQPQAAHTPQIQPKSREPTPIWDIELDLNPSDAETEPTGNTGPPLAPNTSGDHGRRRSPTWDIELDLNNSEDSTSEMESPSKRRKE